MLAPGLVRHQVRPASLLSTLLAWNPARGPVEDAGRGIREQQRQALLAAMKG